jgi:hypothetical protein
MVIMLAERLEKSWRKDWKKLAKRLEKTGGKTRKKLAERLAKKAGGKACFVCF